MNASSLKTMILCLAIGAASGQCSKPFPDDLPIFLTLALAQGVAADAAPKRIFVTNGTIAGNAGGLSAFDAFCNTEAQTRAPGGAFKALAVDGTNRFACDSAACNISKDWVLRANRTYYGTDQSTVLFVANSKAIVDFASGARLSRPFDSSAAVEWWTGLDTDWQTVSPGNTGHCTAWTTGGVTTGGSGQGGATATNDVAISSGIFDLCTGGKRLVCVEQ